MQSPQIAFELFEEICLVAVLIRLPVVILHP